MKEQEHFQRIGLRVGLELHQQVDSSRKLFCHCPPVVREDDPHDGILRFLRPTQSELGEIDPAALFEFQQKRHFYYEYYNDTNCLVETDEEPPHDMDDESITVALIMARLLHCDPVDEIHPMRKIVVDGSNTTGFQRTAIVATDGAIEIGEKRIGIQTICLEEDAARKIADDDVNNRRIYRLDRLGIPLIEIATAPDINTPEEAQATALAIGLLFRSTRRVKRGLGTIRQDVNVSIRDGAVVEIKGLQEIDMLGRLVELEAERQIRLLEIRNELRRRGANPEDITDSPVDVTNLFVKTDSKTIRRVIDNRGSVFALRLKRFGGLVGREIQPERRLGTELSDHAKFWGGVGGIFHTDELPAYGITENTVEQLRSAVGADPDDAVIIVAADEVRCRRALKAVAQRAKEAIVGVPAETRLPLPNATTRYARPRPGASRMYPETDVRPVQLTKERLKKIDQIMPESFDSLAARFMDELGLSRELAIQIVRSENLDLFEKIIQDPKISPTLVANTIESTLTRLRREGVHVEKLQETHFVTIFRSISSGTISADAIPPLLTYFSEHLTASLDEAMSATGLIRSDIDTVQETVRRIVEARIEYIRSQGENAVSGLMGLAMKELRGKADGKLVKELVLEEVRRVLN